MFDGGFEDLFFSLFFCHCHSFFLRVTNKKKRKKKTEKEMSVDANGLLADVKIEVCDESKFVLFERLQNNPDLVAIGCHEAREFRVTIAERDVETQRFFVDIPFYAFSDTDIITNMRVISDNSSDNGNFLDIKLNVNGFDYSISQKTMIPLVSMPFSPVKLRVFLPEENWPKNFKVCSDLIFLNQHLRTVFLTKEIFCDQFHCQDGSVGWTRKL